MPDLEKFVQHAIDICNDDRRGYDQPRRMSGVDIDCSELVRESLAYGGFPVPGWLWTGNMKTELTKRGWTWHPGTAGIKRGDILWKTGHTAVYLGGNKLAEASANEFGGASGGKPGDQTGREVRVRGQALDYPAWAGYFTPTTNNEEDDMVSEADIEKIAQRTSDKIQQANWIDPATGKGTAVGGNCYNAWQTSATEVSRTDDVAGDGTHGKMYDRVAWIDKRVRELAEKFEKNEKGFSGVGDLVACHPFGDGTPESEAAFWIKVQQLADRQREQQILLDKIAQKLGVEA